MAEPVPNKIKWDTPLSSVITQGDMGAAGPIFSLWISFDGEGGSFQYKWPATGTPIGTITMQISNNASDADDVTNLSPAPTNPNGAAGTHTMEVPENVKYARMKYARTSGGSSAALEAWAQAPRL